MTSPLGGAGAAGHGGFFATVLYGYGEPAAAAEAPQRPGGPHSLASLCQMPAADVAAYLRTAPHDELRALQSQLSDVAGTQAGHRAEASQRLRADPQNPLAVAAARAELRAIDIRETELAMLGDCISAVLTASPAWELDLLAGFLDFHALQSRVALTHSDWMYARLDVQFARDATPPDPDRAAEHASSAARLANHLEQWILRAEHSTLTRVLVNAEVRLAHLWPPVQATPSNGNRAADALGMLDALLALRDFTSCYQTVVTADLGDPALDVVAHATPIDLEQAAARSFARVNLLRAGPLPTFLVDELRTAAQSQPEHGLLRQLAGDLPQWIGEACQHYRAAIARVCVHGADGSLLDIAARARELAEAGDALPPRLAARLEEGFSQAVANRTAGDEALARAATLLQRADAELGEALHARLAGLCRGTASIIDGTVRSPTGMPQSVGERDAYLPLGAVSHRTGRYAPNLFELDTEERLERAAENLLGANADQRFFVLEEEYFALKELQVMRGA